MLQSGPLFASKPFPCVQSYKFTISDEILDSFKNEKPSFVTFDVKENIGSIIYGNNSYNTIINYELMKEQLIYNNTKLNQCEIQCQTVGSVVVKGPPTVINRDRNIDCEVPRSIPQRTDSRKRQPSHASDGDHPAKRRAVDRGPAEAVEMLKAGKTVKEVAAHCGITEARVKEYIGARAEDGKNAKRPSGPNTESRKVRMQVAFDVAGQKGRFLGNRLQNGASCAIMVSVPTAAPLPAPVPVTVPPPVARPADLNNNESPAARKTPPFRYVVLDPATTPFRPTEAVDGLSCRDTDSERFRLDVMAAFRRLQECEAIYSRYRDKREDLRRRALASRSEQELRPLFDELHCLCEEERRPFFRDLEAEIGGLQGRLLEASALLGVNVR